MSSRDGDTGRHFDRVPALGAGCLCCCLGTLTSQQGSKGAGNSPLSSPSPGVLMLLGTHCCWQLCHLLPGSGHAAPVTQRGQQGWEHLAPHCRVCSSHPVLLIWVSKHTALVGTYHIPAGGFQECHRVPASTNSTMAWRWLQDVTLGGTQRAGDTYGQSHTQAHAARHCGCLGTHTARGHEWPQSHTMR